MIIIHDFFTQMGGGENLIVSISKKYNAKIYTLLNKSYLFGEKNTLADYSILPFIRQFANIDIAWFNSQPWPKLQHWLKCFISSNRFEQIQSKYPQWKVNDHITEFPEA
jgi:glutathione S-transferase